MTPKEAAKATGYSRSQINRLIRLGKLKAKQKSIPGGFVYDIPRSEIERLKREGKDNRGWNSVNQMN